jgi:hypothetical protein
MRARSAIRNLDREPLDKSGITMSEIRVGWEELMSVSMQVVLSAFVVQVS